MWLPPRDPDRAQYHSKVRREFRAEANRLWDLAVTAQQLGDEDRANRLWDRSTEALNVAKCHRAMAAYHRNHMDVETLERILQRYTPSLPA